MLIDCPPSLGLLTLNALVASTEVIVTLQSEYYALEGLSHLMDTVKNVKKLWNPDLSISGVVLTMYDQSLELTGEVDREVREFFGEIVFQTVIPRDVAVSEAPSHGQSVIDYAPRARGARAYVELCMEVLDRE